MKLFAFGHRRRGRSADCIIEIEGVRLNVSLASRVRAAKHAVQSHADARDTIAASVRDRHPDGSMDYLESERV